MTTYEECIKFNFVAHEFVFSRKRSEIHALLMINNVPVKRVTFHKHLRLILDSKLDFNERINTVLLKVSKTIALIKKVHHVLPRDSLLTIRKIFVRPHLDYTFYKQLGSGLSSQSCS